MKPLRLLSSFALVALIFPLVRAASASLAATTAHVWEKQELTLTAARTYANPYLEVIVWVDLTGPGFAKRIYGFWDGGQTYHLRLLATAPGTWTWQSGSNTDDPGLSGQHGAFTAVEWTDAEKNENPLRRGMIRPTPNQHAL